MPTTSRHDNVCATISITIRYVQQRVGAPIRCTDNWFTEYSTHLHTSYPQPFEIPWNTFKTVKPLILQLWWNLWSSPVVLLRANFLPNHSVARFRGHKCSSHTILPRFSIKMSLSIILITRQQAQYIYEISTSVPHSRNFNYIRQFTVNQSQNEIKFNNIFRNYSE